MSETAPHIMNAPEYSKYILGLAGSEDIVKAVECANSWVWSASSQTSHRKVFEETFLTGLQKAQGIDPWSFEPETDQPLRYSFETVMRAADLISRFWNIAPVFKNWQEEGTYVDGRGETYDPRSEEHTSELQSQSNLVCRL